MRPIDSDVGRPGAEATGVHTPEPDRSAVPDLDHGRYGGDPPPDVLIAGRYTLQEKIGEGGMGEVWVAKQSEPVKRKVALEAHQAGHGLAGRACSDSSRNARPWR